MRFYKKRAKKSVLKNDGYGPSSATQKMEITIRKGDAEIRSRVNEIFLVALFEKSTFLCCHIKETPRRHHLTALKIVSFIWKFYSTNV